jgi:glucose/arabinose dehydrogenase
MKKILLCLAAALLLASLLASPSAARHFALTTVDTGLDSATAIVNAGDDRIFVVAKEGYLWIYRNGVKKSSPYLDIRDRVLFTGEPESEQGLLSAVFDPDYATNGYLFVAYTDRDGVGVVSRFSVSGPDPDHAPRSSEKVLLRVPQPGANHHLNHLAFGPDGLLYIASGDGGYQPEPSCSPQDGSLLLGKILRLDVHQNLDTPPFHAIPASNPFVGDPAVRDEIWALGTRNPWRFSFDRGTGDFWLADVGHRLREEIDFLPAGAAGGQNWGFKMMEGKQCRGDAANCSFPIPPCDDPAYSPPVLDYGHDDRHCAIIGGHVYRGNAIPELRGLYLGGDYCGATFLVSKNGGNFAFEELSTDLFRLIAFGEDAQGETYLLVAGTLHKLVGLSDDGQVAFAAATASQDEDGGTVSVAVKRLGGTSGAVSVGWATVPGSAGTADYVASSGTLSWPSGVSADRTITVNLKDDAEIEGNETFRIALSGAVGASIGTPAETTVEIRDDEIDQGPCVPADTVLCLSDGRFRITATWKDYLGQTGNGHAVPFTFGPSGFLYFFDPTNIEMLVKTLDGCAINNHFWVYAAATTDVEYTLRVIDTETGRLHEYKNTLGVASPTINDIVAFPCD